MERPKKLDATAVAAWVSSHEGWALLEGKPGAPTALGREHSFADYPTTLAFVMRLGFAAEKRDHHPDLLVRWGKVHVSWSTHDAGGITTLDLELAERTDELARG